MNDNEQKERNEHFKGSAKLLWQDLLNALNEMDVDPDALVDGCSLCSSPPSEVAAILEPIISQFAYDLIEEIISQVSFDEPLKTGDNRPRPESFSDPAEWLRPNQS